MTVVSGSAIPSIVGVLSVERDILVVIDGASGGVSSAVESAAKPGSRTLPGVGSASYLPLSLTKTVRVLEEASHLAPSPDIGSYSNLEYLPDLGSSLSK